MKSKKRIIVDSDTGEYTELEVGDRIVRGKSIESFKRRSSKKLNIENFSKTNYTALIEIGNIIAGKKTETLIYMYLSSKVGSRENRSMSASELIKSIGCNRGLGYKAIKNLFDEEIIVKDEHGKYMLNPYISFKGSEIDPQYCEMYKNSKWYYYA